VVFAGIFLLVALSFGIYKGWQWFFVQPLIEVPDVMGESAADAEAILLERGLGYDVLRTQYDFEPPDIVIDQYP